ncbi:MAG TPA: Stp1/IreP family PP2C-type Ser/Thr phosphatase [Candidatus Fimihabitans intestinipullorum]|uniref:protein-serine/threonine phosphatase n=1 Tax=Candidatus Fimihabitans intestinipullorum TaxID=2840820 RepID=A0A9D1HUJ7_9BACT|nr:Stp1/IreP family PP2C-type Ser/Thr phosphatase [Candidatus Fimihabitans intestinipullorum]
MEYYYQTDPGKVRDHNEDSVTIVKNQSGEYLLAVADGMGGHRAGEIASSIVIGNIGTHFKEMGKIGTKEDAVRWLKDAVSEANVEIYKYTAEHPESEGMGTTIVTAILTDDFLLFGNLGDSRGYVLKGGKLHQITTDHTLVNLLVKSGELTEEEAEHHPRKNVLMKALGANTKVEMDIIDVETDVDGILLCSDGLTNMLDHDQIEKVLNEDLEIEKMVQKLIYKSNNRGGNDNISIAYLKKEVA